MSVSEKVLALGTAQWGWTVPQSAAFQILDAWYAAGHRVVDAATNYPINKNPADFRAAEQILREYIRAHGIDDFRINMKLGSLDNLRSPDVNLSPSFLMMMAEEYRRLFEQNLRSVMIHWDNRDDETAIGETLSALRALQQESGLQPGLSGIKHPECYHKANLNFGLTFDLQMKHNILQSDVSRYRPFFPPEQHRYFVYGINAGGLRLDGPYPSGSTFMARGGSPEGSETIRTQLKKHLPDWNLAFVRPPLRTMNHLSLLFSGLQPAVKGLVLGFSSPAQVRETLDFWRNLETFDYSDVFRQMEKMVHNPV